MAGPDAGKFALSSTPHLAPLRQLRWALAIGLLVVAAVIYSLYLTRPLGASEAYTALAAAQGSYAAVVRSALRFDEGKPPLYHLVVHSIVLMFGDSEPALRLPSLIFSVISVALMLALGRRMFSFRVGLAAAVVWALSPLAIIYGSWARMYAMLVALALAQFLLLWRLRSQGSRSTVMSCAALGAAMLYTHLGSTFFLGTEAAMLVGSELRGQRNRAAWIALTLTAVAFAPFLPLGISQLSNCVYGHWVDWIGPAHSHTILSKLMVLVLSGAAAAVLIFGPEVEKDRLEPLRWCAALGLLPLGALLAGSVVLRPMFALRYVAPSVAMLVLLLAAALAMLSARAFEFTTFGIAAFLLFLLPYYRESNNSWRDVARVVAAGGPNQPVFFESGYLRSTAAETNPDQGFPQGFFRVPFDRYFSGPNPRMVIDPSQPAMARQTIASAAIAHGGAWLLTGLTGVSQKAELPLSCFKIESKASCDYATLYHIVPMAHCQGAA